MREFYDRTGHDIKDMLLSCFYRGSECSADNFDVVSQPVQTEGPPRGRPRVGVFGRHGRPPFRSWRRDYHGLSRTAAAFAGLWELNRWIIPGKLIVPWRTLSWCFSTSCLALAPEVGAVMFFAVCYSDFSYFSEAGHGLVEFGVKISTRKYRNCCLETATFWPSDAKTSNKVNVRKEGSCCVLWRIFSSKRA